MSATSPAVATVDRDVRRRSFRKDALRAWTAYETTGAHVAAAEADAWLARLAAGEDVDPPPAHR